MRRFSGWVMFVWACLCLGVLASAQGNAGNSKDLTFLYVSHPVIYRKYSKEDLRKPFDAALNAESKPAFLVINGGLAGSGTPNEWALFRETLTGLPQGFPIYALASGQDYIENPTGKEGVFQFFYGDNKREAKGRPARGNRIEDRLYQSFDMEGVHVVLLDAALPLEPHSQYAHLDTEQLNWLDKDLKKLKKETPVLVFLNVPFGLENISTRPLANEFELWQILRPQNVAAIFTDSMLNDDTVSPVVKPLNGTQIVSLPTAKEGVVHRVRMTPLRISIDEIPLDGKKPPAEIASFTFPSRSRKSVMRAAFDDDGNPFLVRRHPIGLFDPRAVSDNPESETGEYRIDEGNFLPMKRDARDIWRSPFRTESLLVGIHTASIRLKSEGKSPHYSEIIFEVERDNKEATRRWASNLDNPIVSNPVLSGKMLYVSGTDAKLYALDTETGKKRVLLTARGGFYASPCFHEGTVYIGSLDKTFYAVNADNGSLKWKFETDAPIYATAAVAQDIVCFGSNEKVYGVDTRTGKQVWAVKARGLISGEVVTDGLGFCIGNVEGNLAYVEPKTGDTRWVSKRNDASRPANFHRTAAPVISSSKVFFVDNARIVAYDIAMGRWLWDIKLPADGSSRADSSTPAVSATALYFVTNASPPKQSKLTAASTTDGHILWQIPLSQPVIKAGVKLAPDGKSLAVVGVRGSVSVHSTQDGKKLWGYELGPGNVFSTPEYDGQTVYTATMANDVQALNAPGYAPQRKGKAGTNSTP